MVPWEEFPLLADGTRTFGGQVEDEWNTIRRVSDVWGEGRIPPLLAKSAENNTLVFEEIGGTRMDQIVKWSGWARSHSRPNAAVVFQAGIWLRILHDATFERTEVIDIPGVVHAVRQILRSKGLESTRYGAQALRLLDGARSLVGGRGKVEVPVCLQHGDYSLPNLIWDHRRQHLWIADFEHSRPGNILQDLGSFLFNLRSKYMLPWASRRIVMGLEEAFWTGYGPLPGHTLVMANAIATARIFYHLLPRLLTRRTRRGWVAGLTASLYRGFIEPFAIERLPKIPVQPSRLSASKSALYAD
jgi:hypothetical protein